LQATVTGAGHEPLPLHDAAAVAVEPEQLALRQLVEAPG
jgi:hypothetical protein